MYYGPKKKLNSKTCNGVNVISSFKTDNTNFGYNCRYTIMLKCWKDNFRDRPSFADLVMMIDKLLTESVDNVSYD